MFLVPNNQPTPQRNSSIIVNNYLTRNLFSSAVSWCLMFSARKCRRNILLKDLSCLSFYLHQKFCFGRNYLCSIVLVRGSFQDNVVVFFFICSDYHEGPHVRELFVLLRLINTDIVFTIRDVITYKKRRTNDERFHSRTTNKKNRKKMQG